MSTHDPTPVRARASRRELLGGALAGVAVAAATSPADAGAARATRTANDARVLIGLLRTERRLIATYRRVLGAGSVNVVVAPELEGFLAQEREHIVALERGLVLLGAPLPAASSPSVDAGAPTQAAALNTLLSAETVAQSAYLGAVSKLQEPGLVQIAAEIMACEAQHATLLRVLQNPSDLAGSVPAAFVASS